MSFSVVYGRNKRNTNYLFQPTHYPVANFYTNTHKKSEMNSFGDQLFLNNLHLIPDPLKKNLADTLIPQEKATSRITETKSELSRGEYSPLTGISNFFSGVFNMLTNAMSRPKSPVIYYDCSDTDECRQGSPWQSANTEELNRNDQADMLDTPTNVDSNMSSGYRTVVQCEDKLNKVRSLLSNKGTKPTRLKNRVKKVFVEPSSVEDSFEDAFTFEELISIENNTYIKYISPLQHQNQELLEIDAPKIKSEMGPLSDSAKIVVEPEFTDKGKSCCNVNEPTASNENDTKHQLVTSCEDKLSKLKALLQERRKKNTKTIVVSPNSVLEPDRIIEQPKKISKSIPINKTTDKRFKNSNRTCVDKRKKSKLRMNIHEDMMFANEINVDEQSSVENSPSLNSLDILNQKLANGNDADCFNEVSGRFCSTSTTDSEDSFQIVFNDIPTQLRRISDCDSEDSFIVFEDSPDSCYTSNDVFGDSEPECLDSDSELSDSGCLNMTSKLSHSLSKSVSNLTDDSLYINESEDEVDCTANICEPVLSVVNYVSEKEGCSISKSGSLLDEQKKLLRKNMPAKKVQFSTQPPKVHVMRVWAFAARQARAGHWERYSLDRERFKRRIADVDMAVSWVLKPRHRSRVMFQRFMPWWNAQKRKELAEKKLRDEEEKLKNESLKREQESTEIKTENVETYLSGEGIVDDEKICENGIGYTENECKIEETVYKNEMKAEDKLETENGG